MRETRLYDYADPSAATSFTQCDVAVPLYNRPQGFVEGTWAGLVGETISWRMEEGSTIIFENMLTRKGLAINFTAPLTCRPHFTNMISSTRKSILLYASCHANRNSSILMQLRISDDLTSHSAEVPSEELSRLSLQSTVVTAFASVEDDVVAGLGDGRFAIVLSANTSRGMSLRAFSPSAARSDFRRDPGDSTSMVSLASADSGHSHRSSASSMSLALMSRLFRTPRASDNAAPFSDGTSMEHSHMALSGHIRESFRGRAAARDRVIALAEVKLEGKALATLHQSGRICMFIWNNDQYEHVGDTAIPMKLSSAQVDHFLLTGLRASVVAVVMVDEDPSADSLRVYNISAKMNQTRSMSISCTQIAKRDGPVDRVVAAIFTGEDVVVGTDSGSISGLLNVSTETDAAIGIPSGTIWTAIEDLDKDFGLGPVLDQALPGPKTPCMIAYRYGPYAIAKALRRPDPASATRAELTKVLGELEFPEDDDSTWKRVKTRANQITKLEGMKVRDMCLIDSVGIVVSRSNTVYVLRGLSEPERKVYGNCSHLLNEKVAVASGRLSALLSAHAACQVLAAQYRVDMAVEGLRNKLAFMLGIWTRFSEKDRNRPLGDVIVESALSNIRNASDLPKSLRSAIASTLSVLEPGPQLLKGLLSCTEMEALAIASQYSANILPVSSMFASGVSWLAMYRKASCESTFDGAVGVQSGDALLQEDQRLEDMVDKAFGFLITATQWCDDDDETRPKRSEEEKAEDAHCAISLAGLSNVAALNAYESSAPTLGAGATPSFSSLIPNGPNEQLVLENLGFWLLERAVRLLESSGAAKTAAIAALNAMGRAPDRKRHEMMRAAAFSRFVDAGDLENGLKALLNAPYKDGDESAVMSSAESSALRDAIGLFVNATADKGMLQWLADRNLPEPLRVLCGYALERRARAADVLRIPERILIKVNRGDPVNDQMNVDVEEDDAVGDYEVLYSWHILRGDESSAASAALEWTERLRDEGLSLLRAVVNGKPPIIASEKQIRILQVWTKAKCTALSYASSAAKLQSMRKCYIVRSRFSVLNGEGKDNNEGVVDVEWVQRRHLLAHAQSLCLKRMLSDCEDGRQHDVMYLYSQGSPFLDENEDGVQWVVSMLSKQPSSSILSICAELCIAWREEIGDNPLIELVQSAASIAARGDIDGFEYPDLDELLSNVASTCGLAQPIRNWSLVALGSALSASAGAVACPQWLVDCAAWGTGSKQSDVTTAKYQFAGSVRGDAAGVVRAYLRNNRPVDAAKILLKGLAIQGEGKQGNIYVPYSAVDATMEMLKQFSQEYSAAAVYLKKLEERTQAHLAVVSKISKERLTSVNNITMGTPLGSQEVMEITSS